MIRVLLENDYYKFLMMNFVFCNYKNKKVKYKFFCRDKDIDFKTSLHLIKENIEKLLSLRFNDWELRYLKSLRVFKSDFIDYLKKFKFNKDSVFVYKNNDNLEIIIDGNWLDTILLETPILAIVNESYFHHKTSVNVELIYEEGTRRLQNKLQKIDGLDIDIYDFGLRRRFSRDWHDYVIGESLPYLKGTSNVYLAMKYSLPPIGTMAHELIMAGQHLSKDKFNTQSFIFNKWARLYRDKFLIALDDTLGVDKFLKEFIPELAEKYDGTRQDSGDPIENGYKKIKFYENLGIDPMTKKIIFSDSLNFDKIIDIYNEFKDRIQVGFGIGTDLTCDVGLTKLNIVIKMVKMEKQYLIKLSDVPGKEMCMNKEVLDYWKLNYLG